MLRHNRSVSFTSSTVNAVAIVLRQTCGHTHVWVAVQRVELGKGSGHKHKARARQVAAAEQIIEEKEHGGQAMQEEEPTVDKDEWRNLGGYIL
eukprot:360607-Chlamydomonas_euryale.AAC.4